MKQLIYKELALGIVLGVFGYFTLAQIDSISQILFVPCCSAKIVPYNFPELDRIVKEPLRYLGNGCEAMAFASADDQYVIKFFFRRNLSTKISFDPEARFRQLFWRHTTEKRNRTIVNRYEKALQEIPHLTGMLNIHRYISPEPLPMCTVIDRNGVSHSLDLTKLTFVIQKKGDVTDSEYLAAHRQELDPKFREFFSEITRRGFVNIRRSFNPANFALLNDKIIMIDIGELKYAPEKAHTAEEQYLLDRYFRE